MRAQYLVVRVRCPGAQRLVRHPRISQYQFYINPSPTVSTHPPHAFPRPPDHRAALLANVGELNGAGILPGLISVFGDRAFAVIAPAGQTVAAASQIAAAGRVVAFAHESAWDTKPRLLATNVPAAATVAATAAAATDSVATDSGAPVAAKATSLRRSGFNALFSNSIGWAANVQPQPAEDPQRMIRMAVVGEDIDWLQQLLLDAVSRTPVTANAR